MTRGAFVGVLAMLVSACGGAEVTDAPTTLAETTTGTTTTTVSPHSEPEPDTTTTTEASTTTEDLEALIRAEFDEETGRAMWMLVMAFAMDAYFEAIESAFQPISVRRVDSFQTDGRGSIACEDSDAPHCLEDRMSLEVTSEFTTRDYLVDVAWELYQFLADSPLYDFSDEGQTCQASLAFLDEDSAVRQSGRCFEFFGYGGPNLRVVVNSLEAVCSSDFMRDMQSRRKSRADWESECL